MIQLLFSLLILWSPDTGRTTPLRYTDPDPLDDNAPSGIPVLMYHHVSDPVNGYYGVSTGRLRMDLQLLDEAGFQFNGRDAVRIGFLANGSVSSMKPLLDSVEGRFRIGRLDMSQYSVRLLLGWRNIMTTGPRDDLHDPLRPRIP